MFKARGKKNPKHKGNLRRRSSLEDDDENKDDKKEQGTTTGNQTKNDDNANANDDDDDDDGTTLQTIARVKQKRKLLTELQYKKGTDVSDLLKARHNNNNNNNNSSHNDGEDHNHLNHGANKDSNNNQEQTAAAQQEGIMEQKHKQALEEYVEEKLATIVGDQQRNLMNAQQKAQLAEELADKTSATTTQNKVLTKEELYQELAQAAERMLGRNKHSSAAAAAAAAAQDAAVKEGDVGTGGAMLVAGTGLAEVVLPVEERLKAVQATREASMTQANSNKGPKTVMYGGMPKSQVPVPGGQAGRFYVPRPEKRDFMDKPVPEREVNSSSNNYYDSQQNNTPGDGAENAMDADRAGFEALRGKTNPNASAATTGGGDPHGGNNKKRAYKNNQSRASDDKVYGNFVKRQKEMRGRR